VRVNQLQGHSLSGFESGRPVRGHRFPVIIPWRLGHGGDVNHTAAALAEELVEVETTHDIANCRDAWLG
jgi:hypothetical protein